MTKLTKKSEQNKKSQKRHASGSQMKGSVVLSKTHPLKILPQHFQAVWDERKTFELRKDDRDYKVGDMLLLNEWDGEKYTGSAIMVKITHILRNCPEYGLANGYCILSIQHLGKPINQPKSECI